VLKGLILDSKVGMVMKTGRVTKNVAIISLIIIIIFFVNSRTYADGFPHKSSGKSVNELLKGEKSFKTGFLPLGGGSGTYHSGANLVCSDCHTMHASMQLNYEGGTGPEGGIDSFPWSIPANKYLLKKASPLELCLSCHDNKSGIPDVVTDDVNGLTERAAGYFGMPDTNNYKGHKIGTDPGYLCTRCHWGGMADGSVTCVDCHNPHGNGYYRNLQWASDPGGEPEIRAYINPGASGLQRYEGDNIRYPAPAVGDNSFREVTNICIDCHHTFMDDSGAYYTKPGGMAHWGRHPGTNTEWGAYRPINASGANTDPAHWVAGTGNGFDIPRLKFIVSGAANYADAGVVAQNNEVFCLSCHKGHGSDNAFSLRWDYGSGSATAKSGCLQCHNNVQLP